MLGNVKLQKLCCTGNHSNAEILEAAPTRADADGVGQGVNRIHRDHACRQVLVLGLALYAWCTLQQRALVLLHEVDGQHRAHLHAHESQSELPGYHTRLQMTVQTLKGYV